MDIKTAILTCLKQKYVDFTGRASRSEFWYFVLFAFVVQILCSVLTAIIGELGLLLSSLAGLALLLPSISVGVRRMHDTNRSGWWILIGLVPFIGGIVYLVLAALKGTEGDNRFGPDPLGN